MYSKKTCPSATSTKTNPTWPDLKADPGCHSGKLVNNCQLWPCHSSDQVGFVVNKVALGQVFSKYFGFPCRSFHRVLHSHLHPSSSAAAIGQIMAHIPTRLSLTHPKKQLFIFALSWDRTQLRLQYKGPPFICSYSWSLELWSFPSLLRCGA
jgi:hypothetical protein